MGVVKADIAILDDGVNAESYGMGSIQFDVEVDNELSIVKRTGAGPQAQSHGTTCAAIIKKYARDAAIGSIKILNEKTRRGMKDKLIRALHWCAQNGIKLANLSLGTVDYRDFDGIRECVNEAAAKGLIIVAACSNSNAYTLPACLTNAIGVKCKKIYLDDQFGFNPYPFNGIDIFASGRHFLTDACGNSKRTEPSNSFAAPLITAKIFKLMQEEPFISLYEIRRRLYARAVHLREEEFNPYFSMNPDWIRNSSGSMDASDSFSKHDDIRIWDEELYLKRLERMNEKADISGVPIIAIYGNKAIGDIVRKLYLQFFDNGYYCIVVSTNCMDRLEGYEYLPGGMKAKKFLSLVYDKYHCDLIFLKVEDESKLEYVKESVEVDIILYITNNKCNIIDNVTEKNNRVELKTTVDGDGIIDIYSKILQYFEGD